MEHKLIQYFSKITPLTIEESNAIAKSMVTRKLKKGAFLLKAGQFSVDSYFVLEGCIREYMIQDGEEKTTNFFTEGHWVISLNNFTPQSPATLNWICMEDSSLVVGNEQKAQGLFRQFPRLETISRVVMEGVFAEQKKLLTSYLTDTPEQRYLKLLKSRPDLLQRVPQYQLASYIGIKPESLSRIRKRLSQQL